MDSELLFVSVLGSLCGAFVIALVALQRCWRYATLAFVVFLGIYSAIYVGLSVNGRYEPGTWGLDGVKWYIWVPAGFVHDDDHWNLRLVWTFAPLYYVDRRFWHTDDESESGRYPIYRGHVQKKPGFCEGRVAQC